MDPATGGVLITGLKALHEMVKANKDPEMMTQLLEIQTQVFSLVNDNQALAGENKRLNEKLAEKESVELRSDGAVWRKTDTASRTFGGFCPNCFSNGKLIKLNCDAGSTDTPRVCGACKFHFEGEWW